MNKLIVFETNKDETEFNLNSQGVPKSIYTGSVERGAGSISLKINTKGNNFPVFDLVTFIKKDYFDGDYIEYTFRLEMFLKELSSYKLVDSGTVFI